ncbi:MAG TPA: hypothetical protein VM120_19240 [Bryobacteraceae bacterium]|nr:hypothetical protein [Bryobacteraceae bacterium]
MKYTVKRAFPATNEITSQVKELEPGDSLTPTPSVTQNPTTSRVTVDGWDGTWRVSADHLGPNFVEETT